MGLSSTIARRFNQPFYNNNRGTYHFHRCVDPALRCGFPAGHDERGHATVGWNRNYLRATSMGRSSTTISKLTPNLTLNLGIRYEIDMIPADRYNHMTNFVPEIGKVVLAFNDPSVRPDRRASGSDRTTSLTPRPSACRDRWFNPDYNNFAPRVGFAWTPWKDRKTVLRGGYGIFYTGLLLNPFRNNLQNTFPYAQTETYTHNMRPGPTW